MYVPATLGQPTAALAPVGIVSVAPDLGVKPVRTALQVRHSRLNVLADHRVSVTGSLLDGTRAGLGGRLVALQALARLFLYQGLPANRTNQHVEKFFGDHV